MDYSPNHFLVVHNSLFLVILEDECVNGRTNANFRGKLNHKGLPDKNGNLDIVTEGGKVSKNSCVRLAPGKSSMKSSVIDDCVILYF